MSRCWYGFQVGFVSIFCVSSGRGWCCKVGLRGFGKWVWCKRDKSRWFLGGLDLGERLPTRMSKPPSTHGSHADGLPKKWVMGPLSGAGLNCAQFAGAF